MFQNRTPEQRRADPVATDLITKKLKTETRFFPVLFFGGIENHLSRFHFIKCRISLLFYRIRVSSQIEHFDFNKNKCRIAPLKYFATGVISVTALYDLVDGPVSFRGHLIFKGEAVQGKIEAKLEMMI